MPRMARYLEVSSQIYGIYLKVPLPQRHPCVFSIDESFMDLTPYLKLYGMTAHELVTTMIRDVLATQGITATGGIGTNLYLAKIAMDITAKKLPADKDGVRVAELDEHDLPREIVDARAAHRFLADRSRHCRSPCPHGHPHHGGFGPVKSAKRGDFLPGVWRGRGDPHRPRLGNRNLRYGADQSLQARHQVSGKRPGAAPGLYLGRGDAWR